MGKREGGRGAALSLPATGCRRQSYSGDAGASGSSSAASFDQLRETPPQSLVSLSTLEGEVTFVKSSPAITTWITGVIEMAPAAKGTPAERSRWVKPSSAKLKDSSDSRSSGIPCPALKPAAAPRSIETVSPAASEWLRLASM